MKRALMLLLLLTPNALACSIKGFAANNQVKVPAGVTVSCSGPKYETARRILKGANWTEVLTARKGKAGALALEQVMVSIGKSGYRITARQQTQKMVVLQFEKAKNVIYAISAEDNVYTYLMLTSK